MSKKPTAAEVKIFEAAAGKLAELGRKGIIMYLADDNLHLMKGPSHTDDHGQRAQQQNIVATVRIPYAGGGDW